MDTVGWFLLDQMFNDGHDGREQAQAAKLRETPTHMVETRPNINLFNETAEGLPTSKWFIGGLDGATMTCEVSSQLTGKIGGLLVCSNPVEC